MTTLHDEAIYPEDTVYDICRGPGKVTRVDGCDIYVSFGKGRPYKFTNRGVNGDSQIITLFHRPPAIIPFPKDERRAAALTQALCKIMDLFNDLLDCKQ
jgi:hypothetical protein